jgi:hypothetical protein
MCPLCKITEICPLSQSPGAQDIQNTTLLKRSSEEAGLAARDGIAGCKGYRELLTQYFQLNPSSLFKQQHNTVTFAPASILMFLWKMHGQANEATTQYENRTQNVMSQAFPICYKLTANMLV